MPELGNRLLQWRSPPLGGGETHSPAVLLCQSLGVNPEFDLPSGVGISIRGLFPTMAGRLISKKVEKEGQMKVEYLSPGELIPYEKNAKQHPPEQVEHIANSIKRFGWQQPIVIDKDNVVIIGHGRLAAAKELHLEQVPVVYADNLTDEEVKALRLADNKTNESEWDFSKLEEELAELAIGGFDMEQFGFDDLSGIKGEIPDNLDAEEGYNSSDPLSCKLTFNNFTDYHLHENEVKAFAESIGAMFSVVKT